MKGARRITRIAAVATVYAALALFPPFAAFGYGPIQVRLAEALTVLPFISVEYAWGLFIGCILANLGSPFFAYDVPIGSLTTLVAALLTSRMRHPALAPLPPVVLNAVIVSWYVAMLTRMPYLLTAGYIMLGQIVACYMLGYPLLVYILKNQKIKEYLS